MRHIAAVVVASCLATGCSRIPKPVKLVGGGVIGAVGAGMLMQREECGSDFLGLCSTVNAGLTVYGLTALAVGTVVFLTGVAHEDKPPAELAPIVAYSPAPPPPLAPAPVEMVRPHPPPIVDAPSGAQKAIVSRIENRLAIQASLAAAAGQCSSAVVTAHELAKLDPELYSRLLAADEVLARCHGL